jgi:N-acyl-L-homoserine lactone synthetase
MTVIAGLPENGFGLVHPDFSRADGALAFQDLLCASMAYGLSRDVMKFVSVSDAMLERVLLRAGAEPRRCGTVMEIQPGVTTLALEMPCSEAVPDMLEQRLKAILSAQTRAA